MQAGAGSGQELQRPFTTGTLILPKIKNNGASVGNTKHTQNNNSATSDTSGGNKAWSTSKNDSTDTRYATLEARIRAMEEAYTNQQEAAKEEERKREAAAAVEALNDDELTVRLAEVSRCAGMIA